MDTVIQLRGTVYEEGYGLIAKKVMRDKDLSPVAKSIYAYLCSFAGSDKNGERSAFPGVKLMMAELGIKSDDTYYKHREILIEKGYISIEKDNRNNGRFKNNIYYINAVPVAVEKEEKVENGGTVGIKGFPPHPKKPGMEETPYPNFSSTIKSSTKNSSTKNSSTKNQGAISNSSIINSFIINSDINLDDDDKAFEINRIAFKEFVDHFHENYAWDNNELFNLIYLQMQKQKLNMFTVDEAIKQAKRMDKYGLEKINDYPAYFVGGIIRNQTSKKNALEKRKAKKAEEEAKRKAEEEEAKKKTVPFYNWLEQ
ncbi:helix-turn-helix domain-containing protein [Lysinibacillus fusiformis]|jgi:hypothetical protein|uniref:helix-turn-helix domain-containing protein n=1 Tax=Lysinibacillus fusiformis TaxID=28031 RepID=UPI003D088176